MRLEDNISGRLFRNNVGSYYSDYNGGFIIECKAERGKPIPLCVPRNALLVNDLVYMKLYLGWNGYSCERSTPRALYNYMFSSYYNSPLTKLKIKDSSYYAAPGVLFTESKELLFYFAKEYCENSVKPRLYITSKLLLNSTFSGKPMEKFFMSTIVPYIIRNSVDTSLGRSHVIIEMDDSNNTFFIPDSSLITSTPVERINDRLNDILVNNADVISSFVGNYGN